MPSKRGAVGFFAAVFGGTPSQISGPTGPMTVAVAVVVTQHADGLAEAFTIVMLAGLFQIVLSAPRIGSFVSYTPYSVISGFMSGIGAIIIVNALSNQEPRTMMVGSTFPLSPRRVRGPPSGR